MTAGLLSWLKAEGDALTSADGEWLGGRARGGTGALYKSFGSASKLETSSDADFWKIERFKPGIAGQLGITVKGAQFQTFWYSEMP